jgi:hypothetical protein
MEDRVVMPRDDPRAHEEQWKFNVLTSPVFHNPKAWRRIKMREHTPVQSRDELFKCYILKGLSVPDERGLA